MKANDFIIKEEFSENLTKEFTIAVPADSLNQKVYDQIAKVKDRVNLKGFRPGQVPLEVIKKKYGASLWHDECDKIISEILRWVITQKALKLAVSPKIDVKNFEVGDDLEFVAKFEVMPTLATIDFKKVKLEKYAVQITDEDLAREMKSSLTNHLPLDEKDLKHKAQKGDIIDIDYQGSIDDQKFLGGSATNFKVEIGSGVMIEGFEEALIGLKKSDLETIKIRFSQNYARDDLADKVAKFEIKVNSIWSAQLERLSDETLQKFGCKNLDELKEKQKLAIEKKYQEMSDTLFKKEFLEQLSKKYEIAVPPTLVEEQFKSLWEENEQRHKKNEALFKNDKEIEKAKTKKYAKATDNVRFGILLDALAKQHNIVLSSEEIAAEIDKIAANFDEKMLATVKNYYQNTPAALSQIKSMLTETKIFEFITNYGEKQGAVYTTKIPSSKFIKIWRKSAI